MLTQANRIAQKDSIGSHVRPTDGPALRAVLEARGSAPEQIHVHTSIWAYDAEDAAHDRLGLAPLDRTVGAWR